MPTNYFTPGRDDTHISLMEEAVSRAQALGRPFEEEEVFSPAWEQGVEVYASQDTRFIVYQEYPRLWMLANSPQEYEPVPVSTVARRVAVERKLSAKRYCI